MPPTSATGITGVSTRRPGPCFRRAAPWTR
nr:MAG TPA: hypothetical protein [Caudoviricetes sp.]